MGYEDKTYMPDRCYPRLLSSNVIPGTIHGHVVTPDGIVAVNVTKKHRRTCLQFAGGGRLYYRYFDKAYTSRGVVTKARQFAADVTAKPEKGGR